MEREKFICDNLRYLKSMSLVYARKFFAEKDDLFQEGALGILEAFDTYGNRLEEEALSRVAKKVANRKMYDFIKKELRARRFL